MTRKRLVGNVATFARRRRRFITCTILGAALIIYGILFAPWPDPSALPLRWKPDAILILGGGDSARARQGMRLAGQYLSAPVIVTGDGGWIVKELKNFGLDSSRILHEQTAESSMDNALFTQPYLDRLGARRVVLVTNWFHAPRALAVFRKVQPYREFAVSFESKPVSLTPWDRESQRRERLATIWYLLRHRIWSWSCAAIKDENLARFYGSLAMPTGYLPVHAA